MKYILYSLIIFVVLTISIYCSSKSTDYFILGLSSDINFHFSELKIDNNLIKYRFPQIDFQEFKSNSYGIGLNLGVDFGVALRYLGLNLGICYNYIDGEFKKDNNIIEINNKNYSLSIINNSSYHRIKIKPYYNKAITGLGTHGLHKLKYFIGCSISMLFNSKNKYKLFSVNGINEIQSISNDFKRLNDNTLFLNNNHFSNKNFFEYSIFFGFYINYLYLPFNKINVINILPSIQYELSFKSDLYNHIYHSIGLGIELRFGFRIKNIEPDFLDEQ